MNGSLVDRLKKVQGKKKRLAAITAAEKQAIADAEKQPVKSVKIDETQPENAVAVTAAESVAAEESVVEVVIEEVTSQEDAVEETAVTEPEDGEASADLLSTKDVDVIF